MSHGKSARPPSTVKTETSASGDITVFDCWDSVIETKSFFNIDISKTF